MKAIHLLLALCVAMLGSSANATTTTPLPGDSLYQLDVPMTDQDGRQRELADLRGGVVVVSLFYTACPYMCPLIIDSLRQNERALDTDQRKQLSVVLVSVDAKRDTPERLKAMARERQLDTPRWTLAHTDAAHVRSLAAALDIAYRELPDGEFSHASKLVLLDRDGRIVATTDTMGKLDDSFVKALKQQLITH